MQQLKYNIYKSTVQKFDSDVFKVLLLQTSTRFGKKNCSAYTKATERHSISTNLCRKKAFLSR